MFCRRAKPKTNTKTIRQMQQAMLMQMAMFNSMGMGMGMNPMQQLLMNMGWIERYSMFDFPMRETFNRNVVSYVVLF